MSLSPFAREVKSGRYSRFLLMLHHHYSEINWKAVDAGGAKDQKTSGVSQAQKAKESGDERPRLRAS